MSNKLFTSVAKKLNAAIADARRAGDGEGGPRGELVADLERIAGVYAALAQAGDTLQVEQGRAPVALEEPAAEPPLLADPAPEPESGSPVLAEQPAPPTPKVAEEPKPARCQCKGTTKTGDRCKAKTSDPSGYCRKHATQGEPPAGLLDVARPADAAPDVSRMDGEQLKAIFAGLDLATQRTLIALALEPDTAKKAA